MKREKVTRSRFRKDNYTLVGNEVLRRKDLSWKAKGIFVYLVSLPPDWVIYLDEVQTHSTDGRTSFRSGIQELKDKGYLVRKRTRKDDGTFEWKTILIEDPKPETENQSVDNQSLENHSMDNQSLENETLLSTKELSTYKQSTNKQSKSNNNPATKVARKTNKFDENSIEFILANNLYKSILSKDPKCKKPNLDEWATHIDRLHRIDGRDFKEIKDVMEWTVRDSFWSTVILSTRNFRDKFTQLKIQMEKDRPKNNYGNWNEKKQANIKAFMED